MARSSTIRLLCLPYAGGSETAYLPWRAALPAWIDLQPAALPGRGRRIGEAPIDNCQQLVELLWREWHETTQSPYALFGHSMGALLAYELAVRAQGAMRPPQALFVSASAAPSMRKLNPAWTGDDAVLIGLVRSMGGTPSELLDDPEWRDLLLPLLRADFRLCANYRRIAREPLDCPVYILAGRDDPATADNASVSAWCAESGVGGEIRYFPGGHFYLRSQQQEVLRFITAALRSALQAEHGAVTA